MRLTGWTFEQIADAPAQRLDWLLEMDSAAAEATRRATERAMAAARDR